VYNSLGEGWYRAVVVLQKRLVKHWSCAPQQPPESDPSHWSDCYVHFTPPATLEIPLSFRVVSDGQVDPQFRRRVTLEGQFRVLLGNTSFAQWLSFTHVFSLSTGTAVYFAWDEAYDGPIHTNGRFRFWGFPKFGTPDTGSPCDPAGSARRGSRARTHRRCSADLLGSPEARRRSRWRRTSGSRGGSGSRHRCSRTALPTTSRTTLTTRWRSSPGASTATPTNQASSPSRYP
jgi:hypothetical protein